jgi:hypothetical protein
MTEAPVQKDERKKSVKKAPEFWVSDFFGVLECTNIGQTEL